MSDYFEHSEAIISSHPTDWTVHVLGPDEVHMFPNVNAVLGFVTDALEAFNRMYPRRSDFEPLMRVVVSPPTGVTVTEDEVA